MYQKASKKKNIKKNARANPLGGKGGTAKNWSPQRKGSTASVPSGARAEASTRPRATLYSSTRVVLIAIKTVNA